MSTLADIITYEETQEDSPEVDDELEDVKDARVEPPVSYYYNQDPQTKQHVHYETGM